MSDFAEDSLAAALARHEIDVSPEQLELLQKYCSALWSMNEKLNLTRHTDYERFVSRDVVDSMALEQFLGSAEHVLDVGTGGGVPGIILAIMRPDLDVSLCESVAKKAKAVKEIAEETFRGSPVQVTVHHARAEELLVYSHFDTLIARAVAPLGKLVTWFAPHWDAFQQLLLIKGPAWVEERQAAREAGLMQHLSLRKLYSYPLPGTHSESVVLQVRARSGGG